MSAVARSFAPIAVGLALLFSAQGPSLTDAAALELKVSKNFGYQAGSTIQGSFTLTARGPTNLTEVVFRIDDQVLGVDNEPPFQWRFSTSDFSPGRHEVWAVGRTATGEQLQSEIRELTFITPDAVMGEVMKILVPISGALVLLTVAGIALTAYLGRRTESPGIGVYGRAGGAVCGRCGFPFSRKLFSPNLVLGKLERCPHCGKWSVVGRAKETDLSAAEDRLREESHRGRLEVESEGDRMRRLIEESRYED